MKAIAAALVLIASAAVVLWFGNTLNSWVLGGLIGGLAALLLSIPISLTLFSYLARRHDERYRTELQEEMTLAQEEFYGSLPHIPAHAMVNAYDIERYAQAEEEWYDEEEVYQQEYASRNYPPSSQHLPAADYSQASSKSSASQRRSSYGSTHSSKSLSVVRGKDALERSMASRRLYPGYEVSSRSQHQSAAIRAARQEVVQQYDDVEATNFSRRLPLARPSQSLAAQHQSRRLLNQSPQRPQRIIDANHLPQKSPHRSLPLEYDGDESQTASIDNSYPPTGRLSRPRQLREQRLDQEMMADNFRKPLVRRAPYMYEDDPLREELSQHLEAPRVRRSSRLDAIHYEEDEEK
jgi:hypothetical protein